MPEKPYTGLTASVKLDSSPNARVLAYISGATLNLEKDIIEILAFGHKFKEKVPAIKDWSLNLDGTVAIAKEGTQRELYERFDDAAPITVGIYLDDVTYFEGTGFVQSFNIDAAPDDKINLTSTIAGSGATILNMDGDVISGSTGVPPTGGNVQNPSSSPNPSP